MAQEVIMPKAGMAMEEGTVIKWLKREGEAVEQGEPLLEIETDKVNMEVESPASGFLLKILADEGVVVPVTKTIGYIGSQGETVEIPEPVQEAAVAPESAKPATTAAQPAALKHEAGRIAATPLAKTLSSGRGIPLDTLVPTGRQGQILARDIPARATAATPLAKKIAEAQGLPLAGITGTGAAGKIVRDDVLRAASAALTEGQERQPVPLSGIRKVIAARMTKSHLEIPPVTLNSNADVTELSALRKSLNEKQDRHITFNDFAVFAAAGALHAMPEVNIGFAGEGIVENEGIHIGIAVALENGLVVPVLRDADTLGLQEVSLRARDLADRARQGTLLPDDYTGGTFTVSNLGMFGVTSFTPIINQPESMILGVCATEPRLAMDDAGRIEKRLFMGMSLTFDHRCLDGAKAAAFLKRVVFYLEHPIEMLV
jgi:pyruvate dehydrogenase E2 component (dihydrolipoamide acetyltransferase)